jgi:hypothetical protein
MPFETAWHPSATSPAEILETLGMFWGESVSTRRVYLVEVFDGAVGEVEP